MKKKEPTIGLSGIINGVEFRFGIANQSISRKVEALGPGHLKALYALLSFVDPGRLDQSFEIDEAAFSRRFPEDNILPHLKELLNCWVWTRTGRNVTVFCNFSAVSFYEAPNQRLIFVTFSQSILPVLKGMIACLRRQPTLGPTLRRRNSLAQISQDRLARMWFGNSQKGQTRKSA